MDPNLRPPTGKRPHANPVIQRRLEKARRQRQVFELNQMLPNRKQAPEPQGNGFVLLVVLAAAIAAGALWLHPQGPCRSGAWPCPTISGQR